MFNAVPKCMSFGDPAARARYARTAASKPAVHSFPLTVSGAMPVSAVDVEEVITLPTLSLRDPFASDVMNGRKTYESRSSNMLSAYAGKVVAIRRGRSVWDDARGVPIHGYTHAVPDGRIVAVALLGRTVTKESLLERIGQGTISDSVGLDYDHVGPYCTPIVSVALLPAPMDHELLPGQSWHRVVEVTSTRTRWGAQACALYDDANSRAQAASDDGSQEDDSQASDEVTRSSQARTLTEPVHEEGDSQHEYGSDAQTSYSSFDGGAGRAFDEYAAGVGENPDGSQGDTSSETTDDSQAVTSQPESDVQPLGGLRVVSPRSPSSSSPNSIPSSAELRAPHVPTPTKLRHTPPLSPPVEPTVIPTVDVARPNSTTSLADLRGALSSAHTEMPPASAPAPSTSPPWGAVVGAIVLLACAAALIGAFAYCSWAPVGAALSGGAYLSASWRGAFMTDMPPVCFPRAFAAVYLEYAMHAHRASGGSLYSSSEVTHCAQSVTTVVSGGVSLETLFRTRC